MKKSSVHKLIAIYEAMGGMVSEMPDPFDGFYKGGTEALLRDFEKVLEDCGVKFAEKVKGQYFIVSYWDKTNRVKKWGICTDKNAPNASWVLTGISSDVEALKMIMNPEIFTDYKGQFVEVIDAIK